MGAHLEALNEGVLLVPLDPRYTQVRFNLVSVQVCRTQCDSSSLYIHISANNFLPDLLILKGFPSPDVEEYQSDCHDQHLWYDEHCQEPNPDREVSDESSILHEGVLLDRSGGDPFVNHGRHPGEVSCQVEEVLDGGKLQFGHFCQNLGQNPMANLFRMAEVKQEKLIKLC